MKVYIYISMWQWSLGFEKLGFTNIKVERDIIDKVYDEKEMDLYSCTPSFKIVGTKE
ncbi:hypothetical protein K0040_04065 [Terrisporobacter petrolearius]|uniref:hypothetical protein n=1 Tax=Terrisporobacter petrolearius TaxID=1460447 RepID=UPI001D16905A|nr:hypothetical protein [Terrisporobacter petrolearius]MCC3863487.1 hypothetical protein [Terrisporobacter petrolearius]